MPLIDLPPETIERLDSLRDDEEAYDEILQELVNIYEASDGSIARRSDWR